MKIEEILKKVLEIPDLVLNKHNHSNKSIIDKITQALLDNWNSAYIHISDSVKHITFVERNNWNDADSKKHTHENKAILDKINQSSLDNWNDKYTKNEIDNKISRVITDLDWKESVNTFSDIARTCPNPDDGWTVNVKDNNITYRYDGSKWIDISSNSIPLATSSLDGRMSKQDKIDHDDMNTKKHIHANKIIIDTITQGLINSWNSAFAHISDSIKHITSDERTLWNTVSNKLDNSGGNVKGKLLISEIDNFKDQSPKITLGLGDNDTGFNSVSDGITEYWSNNVKRYNMNDVYHTGNKPSKSDVGLGNVDNTSDLDKPISKAVKNALNDKSDKGHKHSKSEIIDFPTSLPASGGIASYLGNSYEISDYNTFIPDSVSSILKSQGNVMSIKAGGNANSPWQNTTSGFLFQSNGVDSYHIIIFRSGGDGYAYRSCYQNKWGSWKLISFDGHNHNYNDLINKPAIPNKISQLTNDAGYITQKDVDTSQNHVHGNKSVLDKINQNLIDSWSTVSNKSDKSYVDRELEKKSNTHNHPYRADTWTPSWNDVTGKPSTYTPSGHTHDDRYYTESEMNNRLDDLNNKINSKANSSHSHGYLPLSGGQLNNGSSISWNCPGDGAEIFAESKENVTKLVLSTSDDGDQDCIVMRNRHWKDGEKDVLVVGRDTIKANAILNANNLQVDGANVYTTNRKPDKSDIGLNNVDNTKDTDKPISTATQNALNNKVDKTASCNKNWNWSGQGGQPSWLWGGNDPSNVYVYNPSNFNVNYAKSTGNADMVDGKHANDFASNNHNHDSSYLRKGALTWNQLKGV